MGQNLRILVRKRKYWFLIFTTIICIHHCFYEPHKIYKILLQNGALSFDKITYIILRYMWDICKCLDSSQLILSPNSTPKGSPKKQCYIGYSQNSVIKYSILMLRNRAVKVFGSSSQSVFCAVWGKVLSDLSTYF